MDLKKFYLDPKFPGSYSGAYKFYQEVKNIHPKVTLKKVNEFLKSQDAYTLHKRTRKPKFRRTLVFKPRDLWQIDLLMRITLLIFASFLYSNCIRYSF